MTVPAAAAAVIEVALIRGGGEDAAETEEGTEKFGSERKRERKRERSVCANLQTHR